LFVKSGGVFFLKGLVSASLLKEGHCDVSNFALFTNVNKFIEWIDVPTEQISSTLVRQKTACGIMSSSAGLVQNGKKSTNVQWPWVVVVFNKAFVAHIGDDSYSDFEVGTLISEKHVIADGLYFSKNENGKRVPISTDLIKTYFGVLNLDEYASTNSLVLDGAEKIILHPTLGNIDSLKFANFVIIKLKSVVTFSQYISPICLSSFADDPYSLVGKFGYSVGQGYSATGKTKDREYSPMRIRSKDVCDRDYEYSLGTAKNKSSLYFCAGGDGKSNACWSDHPFYMKFSDKWYLHAFFQVAYNDGKGCKLDLPVLYEIAGQYYNFIQNQIDED
jgi:Trypsin